MVGLNATSTNHMCDMVARRVGVGRTVGVAAKLNNGDTALDLLEEEEDEEDDSAAAGAASLPPPIDSLAATGDGGEL